MPILDPARQADIAEFAETFAPFSATIELGTATEFVTGDLQFNGSGETEAMPAQQRMIAEWGGCSGWRHRVGASAQVGVWRWPGTAKGHCRLL
ncbi:MAG: hypothetical protein R2932_50115 [Caldilineaceae bacterium]